MSEAAGAKITETDGVSVIGNVFGNNRSNGLWLDIDVRDARVVDNRVESNARHGIFFEWSTDGVIASNTVVGNGVSGIAVADAEGVAVRSNTLEGNAVAFILQRDGRAVPSAEDGPAGVVLAGNHVEGARLIWARDYTGRLDADALLASCEGNSFSPAGGEGPVAEWWRGKKPLRFATAKAFAAETGCDFSR